MPDGTELDPWVIETKADLQNIGYVNVNSATWATGLDDDGIATNKYNTWSMNHFYKLANDINLNGAFTPIGYMDGISFQGFGGTFDGQNFTISGGTISFSTSDYVGVFCACYNGHIKNLKVNNSVTGKGIVGGIAGRNYNTYNGIVNCHNSGTILGYGNEVGGVTGRSNSPILNCSNSGIVRIGDDDFAVSRFDYGGITGRADASATYLPEVTKCFNTGNIGTRSRAAGIAGSSYMSINDCYNTGTITGGTSTSPAGGITGRQYAGSSITNCYNVGTVDGSSGVGGIVGLDSNDPKMPVVDSYFNALTGGSSTNGGTSKTTAEMQNITTYQAGTGWDIIAEASYVDEIWYIPTSDYPKLGWQYISEPGGIPIPILTATQVGDDIELTWTYPT